MFFRSFLSPPVYAHLRYPPPAGPLFSSHDQAFLAKRLSESLYGVNTAIVSASLHPQALIEVTADGTL
jgi:hypothetical protein